MVDDLDLLGKLTVSVDGCRLSMMVEFNTPEEANAKFDAINSELLDRYSVTIKLVVEKTAPPATNICRSAP